ncbi:collagen-binding domain-containing protein [Leadbetterella sp. DM7]|uniref:collagen-binding domain-containing protein n=1 Tax=Leadbetterella sp. DM7 TaxID=3235085 RepID=UPI00349ED682
MLTFQKSFQWLSKVLCFIFFPLVFVNAQFNPTDAAKGFNVITSGNFKANRDVEGGVAVGGRLTIYDNLQVNMHSSGTETFKDVVNGTEDAQYVGLIVGDGVTYTSGKVDVQNSRYVKIKDLKDSKRYLENNVYQGIIVHKDATSKNVYIQGNQNQSEASLKRDVSDVFNFTAIFNEFQTYSDALKNSPANAVIESYDSGNKYRFKLTSNQTNIINITKTQLYTYSSKGELGWTVVPSASTPVVINVDMQGGDFDWNNKPNMMINGVSTGQGEFVLWNFYNGTGKTLKLNNSSYLIGSVYALGISVEKYEGYVEGQIVAKDFYQNGGEVHYKRFKTTVTPPGPTVCTGCTSENMIYNPDFEINPTSPDGWNPEVASGVNWGTFYHNGTLKYVGYLNWNDARSNNYIRQNITNGVVGGKTFTYTATASTHNPNGSGAVAQLWLEFYNSSGTKISETAKQSVTAIYSNFQNISITGTIPANTVKIVIVGYSYGRALKFDNNLLVIDCYDKIAVTTTKADASCTANDGSIIINTTGGSGQFTYTLKNGSTTVATSPALAAGATNYQYTFSGLASGTYTVTVTDNNTSSGNCKWTSGNIVIAKDPVPTTPTGISDKSICAGESVTLPGSCTTGTLKWYDSNKTTVITGASVTPGNTTTYYARCESTCNSDWASMKVTVNAKPTVNVNSGTVCSGEKMTLTATVTNCTGTITWTAGGYSQGTGTSIEVQPASTTVYRATCKNATNCEAYGEGTVSVKPKPTISVADVAICLGETAVLEAKNCTGTVTWSPANGASGNKVTITPAAAGEITYTATCTNDGCTASATAKITVNARPVITNVTGGELTCAITRVTVQATASPGTGVTYTWTVPSGVANPGNVASFSATVAGTYKVKVKNNTTGCESDEASTTVTEDKNVETITATGGTLTCSINSVTLKASGNGTKYEWSLGGTKVGEGKELAVTTKGTYTVTVTYTNGCTTTAQAVVDENKDVETITATGGTLTCSINSVTLKASGNGTKYEWSLGGTKVGEGKELAVTAAGMYTVTVTYANGCTTTAQAEVTIDNDKPTVILETGKLTCLVNKVTVAAAATGNGITYKWTVPAGATDPGNVAGFETSVPGVYSVEVTSSNGCMATDQVEVQQDTSLPTVVVEDKVMSCGETEVTLMATGTAGVTYSWTGPDGFTATTKEITVSKTGTYKVVVTSLNGCSATDEAKVTKKDKPESPVSGPHKVCYGEEITLSATCSSGTVKWYSDAALTQELSQLTFSAQQSKTYYAVCTTPDCVSAATESVVTVTPDFPAPVLTATPEEVVKGGSSTLSGSCETGTLVWYKDAGLTQVLGTGATLEVTPDTTTTYYAACELETCKKPSEVTVKVKDQIFDLALRKTIKGGGKNPVVYPGSSITFEIEVFNQGNVTASNIQVTDYIPAGLTLNDGNWTAGGGKATLNTKIGTLAAGASTKVEITFTVNADFKGKAVNAAEISSADGGDDIDSTPDDNPGNDGTPKDNEIGEDGKHGGDEDDHDIEEITVVETPVFDLALRKTLKAGQKSIFKPGDSVTFEITVFNQGNVDATDIDLVDYIPEGLMLNDGNWTLDGSKARWAKAIASLPAGGEATVSISFKLKSDVTGGVIINTAEISGAKNDKGLEDIDSTPDDIKDNDGVVKNDEIHENGKQGGDEDDHDIEPITVCPDQKCLTAKTKVKK